MSTAVAATPGVADNAHFFSDDTVKTANEQITKLKRIYNKDVVIETFPSIPDNLKAQYKPENKNQFFANWFRDRAKELKVDGVYILICKDPGHLQVGASANLYREGFTTADRDTLRNTLLDRFRKKEYDAGLTDAVHILSNKFFEMSRTQTTSAKPSAGTTPGPVPSSGSRGSSGSSGSTSSPSSWSWLVWLGIIAGAFIIIRLISSAFRGASYPRGPGGPGYGPGYGGGAPGYGGGGPGGGGGFFSGLLGGLFGGMAGNWLSRGWFGGGHEGTPPSAGPGAPPDDYGSSGGDFGGPSNGGGGGDFGGGGGGDFGDDGGGGGGDFGGGDSGGGGGGGGGGDF